MPIGKKRTRSLRSLGLASLLVEVNEARGPHTYLQAVCVRSKEIEKKIPQNPTTQNTPRNKSTATRRPRPPREGVRRNVPRVSPYLYASSIDPGLVEIGLACIYIQTCPQCCCCAACIRFDALLSRQRSFFFFSTICISGFGVVRWCFILSFP